MKVSGAGLAFLLQVYIARLLPIDQFGRYVILMAWINFITLFARLGMDSAALRFVPSYIASGEWAAIRGYVALGSALALGGGTTMGLLALAAWMSAPEGSTTIDFAAAAIAALLIPVSAFFQTLGTFVQALKRAVTAHWPQLVGRPLAVLAMLAAFIELGALPPNLTLIFAANLVAGMVVAAYLAWALYRFAPATIWDSSERKYETRRWLSVAVPLLMITGFNIIFAQADIVMLGLMRGPTESGIYAAAARTAGLIGFALAAMNAIAAPLISQYHTEGRLELLQRTLSLAAIGIFATSMVLVLVLFVFGNSILNLFGSEFIVATDALRILALANLVSASMGCVGYLMTMTGHHSQALIVLGSVALLNVTLNAVLIPLYGVQGAASATGVAMVVWNIGMYVYARRRIGLDPSLISIIRLRR